MTNPKWEWAGWKRKPSKYESRGYELLVSNHIKTFTFTGKHWSFRVGWRKVYNYGGPLRYLDGIINGTRCYKDSKGNKIPASEVR